MQKRQVASLISLFVGRAWDVSVVDQIVYPMAKSNADISKMVRMRELSAWRSACAIAKMFRERSWFVGG
jgi:hypothetical protein